MPPPARDGARAKGSSAPAADPSNPSDPLNPTTDGVQPDAVHAIAGVTLLGNRTGGSDGLSLVGSISSSRVANLTRPVSLMTIRVSRLLRCLPGFALLAAPLHAQGTTAREDAVPAHDTLSVFSRAVGETRLINVHTPPGYASASARFPVLYMPDGGINEDFPHVVQTIDSLIAAGAIRPVIVVGIPNTERRRDMTGPTRFAADSAIATRVGGSAAFRGFIRDELIPVIETRYRTTKERAIVGESLAGLFIVETFLAEPSLFKHYIALDPSVWWNGGALVDAARVHLSEFDAAPRTLYLATANVPEITAGTARLAEFLSDRPPRGLTWVYAPRPDLTHATIYRAAGPAALVNALR